MKKNDKNIMKPGVTIDEFKKNLAVSNLPTINELSKIFPKYVLNDLKYGKKLTDYFEKYSISDSFPIKLRVFLAKYNISYKELGKKLGITEGAVSNWLNMQRKPDDMYDTVYKLSKIFNVPITDFLPETLQQRKLITTQELKYNLEQYRELLPNNTLPPTVKKISLTNGYVGAGSSGLMEDIDVVDEIYIDINTIAKRYRNNDINGIVVVGDSMQPWVNNGDIVLYSIIDPTFPRMDGKYIISIDGNLMVKNIKFKVNGDIIISSENKAYSDDIIKSDSQEQDYFRIVGAVAGRILKG